VLFVVAIAASVSASDGAADCSWPPVTDEATKKEFLAEFRDKGQTEIAALEDLLGRVSLIRSREHIFPISYNGKAITIKAVEESTIKLRGKEVFIRFSTHRVGLDAQGVTLPDQLVLDAISSFAKPQGGAFDPEGWRATDEIRCINSEYGFELSKRGKPVGIDDGGWTLRMLSLRGEASCEEHRASLLRSLETLNGLTRVYGQRVDELLQNDATQIDEVEKESSSGCWIVTFQEKSGKVFYAEGSRKHLIGGRVKLDPANSWAIVESEIRHVAYEGSNPKTLCNHRVFEFVDPTFQWRGFRFPNQLVAWRDGSVPSNHIPKSTETLQWTAAKPGAREFRIGTYGFPEPPGSDAHAGRVRWLFIWLACISAVATFWFFRTKSWVPKK
jgi:hypothetical protein